MRVICTRRKSASRRPPWPLLLSLTAALSIGIAALSIHSYRTHAAAHGPLPSEVYIWRRAWHENVGEAITQVQDLAQGFAPLAAPYTCEALLEGQYRPEYHAYLARSRSSAHPTRLPISSTVKKRLIQIKQLLNLRFHYRKTATELGQKVLASQDCTSDFGPLTLRSIANMP